MCSFAVPTRGRKFDTVTNALAYYDAELITDMCSFAVPTRGRKLHTVTNALAHYDVELITDTYSFAVNTRGREFDNVTNALAYYRGPEFYNFTGFYQNLSNILTPSNPRPGLLPLGYLARWIHAPAMAPDNTK